MNEQGNKISLGKNEVLSYTIKIPERYKEYFCGEFSIEAYKAIRYAEKLLEDEDASIKTIRPKQTYEGNKVLISNKNYKFVAEIQYPSVESQILLQSRRNLSCISTILSIKMVETELWDAEKIISVPLSERGRSYIEILIEDKTREYKKKLDNIFNNELNLQHDSLV